MLEKARWLVRVEPISKWGSRRVFAEVRLVSANPLHFFLQISEEIFFLFLAKRAQLRNFWDICTKKAPAVESCSMKEAERKRLLVQRCDCCGALYHWSTGEIPGAGTRHVMYHPGKNSRAIQKRYKSPSILYKTIASQLPLIRASCGKPKLRA